VAVIGPWREVYTNGDDSGEGYLMIQVAGDTLGLIHIHQNNRVPERGYTLRSARACQNLHCVDVPSMASRAKGYQASSPPPYFPSLSCGGRA